MTIGEKIKKLRLNADIKQSELADKINVSKQTLYKYEKNIITNIPIDKITQIAKVLNCSPSLLLGWETERVEKLILRDNELVRNLLMLNGDSRIKIKQIILQLLEEQNE